MWRKGNPSTLLVGMQTGAATVETSMEFPQKNNKWNCSQGQYNSVGMEHFTLCFYVVEST